ncbi:hypothetical protein ACFQLX_25295 [Streptomyces polyrhachis]|uniref:Uncharacterized protein n=1 Tax=Streptomyces polyrhachis TaxID=1282885 RepID=A0ABW2GN80_9ACTN
MITVENLFTSHEYHRTPGFADWDPLKDREALEDAQLLDARMCPTASRAALLFDMRLATNCPAGNSGLLIVHGMQSFRWVGAPPPHELMAFSATSIQLVAGNGEFRLNMEFFLYGELAIDGERSDFYLLESHNVSGGPPNYLDRHLDQVRGELPWWDSECTVLHSSTSG